MLQWKFLAALAAVLTAGVTLGSLTLHARAGTELNGLRDNGLRDNGLGDNGLSLNRVPFDFGAISVEEVQFPAVSSE